MNQADIDAINEMASEAGHRLRLEEGCLGEYFRDADLPLLDGENTFEREECMDPTMPRSQISLDQEKEEADVIFGTQLQNVADKLNGTIIYQTIVNHDGTSYKRIIIEYAIKHD